MTQEELKQIISYNKYTGVITRLDRANSNGSIDRYGYLIIKIKGKQYKAHRLAWLYEYGKFPDYNIDHINGIRDDNRIENLRSVSQSINAKERNFNKNKNTDEYGIYIDNATKNLIAKFTLKDGKQTLRFRTLEEAIEARREVDLKRGILRRNIC